MNLVTHLLKKRKGKSRLWRSARRWNVGGLLPRYTKQLLFSTVALPTIAGNASTCAYCPPSKSIAITDNGVPAVHEFFLDGTLRRSWTISGFTDTEGICWCFGDIWCIGEEGNPGIVNALNIVRAPRDGAVSITKGGAGTIRTINTAVASGSNLGIEGVTFDPECGCFYFITEKPNAGLWQVWKATWDGSRVTPLFDLNPLINNNLATDISDCHFDRLNRHLYLVSHEGFKVFRFTLDGRLLGWIPTPAIFTQPEGMCLLPDLTELLITSEARIYGRYRRS